MLLGTMGIRKVTVVGGIALLALAAMTLPGEAGVKPGDIITADKAVQVSDLVSPGVYYKVQRGMTMKIVPTLRIDWPPPYKDATEKYSSQVTLSKDHRTVVGYVAGQPFPLIDANDPDVATKIVWNNVFRPIPSDDYDLRYFDCDTVYTGSTSRFLKSHMGSSATTPATIWSDAPKSSRSRSIPTSRRTTACGCSSWGPSWRRRTRAAPACCVIVTRIRLMATIRGPGRPDRAACAVSTRRSTRARPDRRPGIPITIRASTPRPSSTTTSSSARRRCWRRLTPSIHRKSAAPPTAAPAPAPNAGRCATCIS